MQPKKLVFVIFEEGIRLDVMEALEQQGIEHYTHWTDLHGSGVTGRKAGNPVWPGLNDVLLLALDEPAVQPLVEALHALRDSLPITPGLRFIVTDAMFI